MQFKPIGKINTPYKTKKDCPIQSIYSPDAEGNIEIFKQYADGLKDIETFSHLYILYLFDRAGEIQLIRPTFLDDEPHGIYASRHPCRPNSIGMSIVQLKKRAGNTLIVRGVDVLDGTPLLDIKPYIPKFDIIESATNCWIDGTQYKPMSHRRGSLKKLTDGLLRRKRQFPSHSYGMVGVIKELVDELGMDMITNPARKGVGPQKYPKFRKMEITPGQVFIVKANEKDLELLTSVMPQK